MNTLLRARTITFNSPVNSTFIGETIPLYNNKMVDLSKMFEYFMSDKTEKKFNQQTHPNTFFGRGKGDQDRRGDKRQ